MAHVSDFLVWGNNQANLLSKSASKCLSTPVPLSLPYEIVSVCASEKHISFITKEGQLFSFGSNLDGRLGVSTRSIDKASFGEPIQIELGSKIIRAESGFSHMCVLTERLELFSWGLGDYGALGTGEFKSRSTPHRVDLSKEMIGKLRQISCGAMHTAFLLEDGTVYTCGSNQYGQLGVNKPEKISSPIPISFHLPIQQISCGVFYTLLLTKDGRVYGMGNNKYGQLGTGHKVNECHPTLIRQLTDIVKVTAGYHSGAIDKFGSLYIWGSGSFGELLRPKKFVLSVPIQDIAIRGFFGIAIGHTSKNQNRIYSWGNNTFGELGLGNYEASKQPQQIETLRGLEVNKIALGVNFALVLLHPPAIHSRLIQEEHQQREKSKKRHRKQLDRSSNGQISDRKSVIGFEQKYLTSGRRNQDSQNINNKSKESNLFEGIKAQRSREAQKSQQVEKDKSEGKSKKRDEYRDREDPYRSVSKSPKMEKYTPPLPPPPAARPSTRYQSRYEPRYDTRYDILDPRYDMLDPRYDLLDPRYDILQERPARHRDVYIEPYTNSASSKDYQKLFIQLSADYEALVKKYVKLERQIQSKPDDLAFPSKSNTERQKGLVEENLALKNQISKLSHDIIVLNDEQRGLKRKNEQLLIDNQKFTYDQARGSNITLSPSPPLQNLPLSVEIEQQYNKLLTQKEQTITKLNLSLQKSEQQFKASLNKVLEQNSNLKGQLNEEIKNNRKIIDDHQSLIDELEVEIKKSEQINILFKEENQAIKSQFVALKNRNAELEKAHVRANQMIENEKIIKDKYEATLKESKIKGEELNSRVAQLEVQLSYEKEFNQKYQQKIQQIQQESEKLHRQLNNQSNLNIQRTNKIENLKQEVEKFKKYKKELDEKNIQVQEFNNSFEAFKKKSKEIIEEKDKEIKSQEELLARKTKQFESNLDKKQMEIQDFLRENTRLEKELNKSKQSISLLKNEVTLKNDELQHLSQQKNNMEKKVTILSAEIKKQLDERQSIVKQLGEAKRQVSRLKIVINEYDAKLKYEAQEKEKAQKSNALKDDQIHRLQQENEKLSERCENLTKQNTQYRQQIQEVSYELENQTKINGELTKANREFAEGEEEYTQKINELQAKVYQLEDENKSYTPRYQALLMRNRQLDDRNRELGEMINKAIQIQAQSYKNNILKQVQINTDNIISQFKQEQEFQIRGRRNKSKQKQMSQELADEGSLTKRGEKTSTVIKEQPYTKMMKQRITQHKRKVSQSAQKLASLLEMNDKTGKGSKELPDRQQTQDYQKINSQMESFNNQKEQFMTKIHSFAEKLKII